MRILKLTPRTEKWLLARRAQRDDEAQSVAAEIVADVRKRGDAALLAWTKKLDGLDLSRDGVWISKEEIRSAKAQVSPDLLKAIRSDSRHKDTPVLVLSNTYLPEMSQRALRAGGSRALPRPSSPSCSGL